MFARASAFPWLAGCGNCANAIPRELVMRPGTVIDASAGGRGMQVTAVDSLNRKYQWNNCTLESHPCVRDKRWYGMFGLYDPAPESFHWNKGCEGITRPVIQEGQIHFKTQALAEWWVREYSPHPDTTVWTNDGLLVRFAVVPERYQLNVDVVRICVDGQSPKAFGGARNEGIRVTGPGLFECAKVSDDVMKETVQILADSLPPSRGPKPR